MPDILDPQLKRDLSERIRYYNELGIYDFYRREPGLANIGETEDPALATTSEIQTEQREEMTPRSKAVAVPVPEDDLLEVTNPKAETGVTDAVQALRLIREDLGDCTRCRLSKQGRKQIVFGVGNPKAELRWHGPRKPPVFFRRWRLWRRALRTWQLRCPSLLTRSDVMKNRIIVGAAAALL